MRVATKSASPQNLKPPLPPFCMHKLPSHAPLLPLMQYPVSLHVPTPSQTRLPQHLSEEPAGVRAAHSRFGFTPAPEQRQPSGELLPRLIISEPPDFGKRGSSKLRQLDSWEFAHVPVMSVVLWSDWGGWWWKTVSKGKREMGGKEGGHAVAMHTLRLVNYIQKEEKDPGTTLPVHPSAHLPPSPLPSFQPFTPNTTIALPVYLQQQLPRQLACSIHVLSVGPSTHVDEPLAPEGRRLITSTKKKMMGPALGKDIFRTMTCSWCWSGYACMSRPTFSTCTCRLIVQRTAGDLGGLGLQTRLTYKRGRVVVRSDSPDPRRMTDRR